MKPTYISFLLFLTSAQFVLAQSAVLTVELGIEKADSSLVQLVFVHPTHSSSEDNPPFFERVNSTTFKKQLKVDEDYKLTIVCINYEKVDTMITIESEDKNLLFQLSKKPNPFNFERDLVMGKLEVTVHVGGSQAIVMDKRICKKFLKKYKVSLAYGGGGCIYDNTNYGSVYNNQVISYLDEKYRDKWRVFLTKIGVDQYEGYSY
ncbi:hypothetical protein R9C00_10495 [Flammeovirgaceae bacterium SG7u.111]|nr:hypothetical protein [Flammeovirgaceae bacterium SG7u.132]WPO37882.1 hypothetical protein R9C00_10495 [Flammeovirgaceae bacterium SG7u.111]